MLEVGVVKSSDCNSCNNQDLLSSQELRIISLRSEDTLTILIGCLLNHEAGNVHNDESEEQAWICCALDQSLDSAAYFSERLE